jgi:hypothetical protein
MVEGYSVIIKKSLEAPKILLTKYVNYVHKKRSSDTVI